MAEIPDDVMERARALYEAHRLDSPVSVAPYCGDVVAIIADALMAEREAQREKDALIAETNVGYWRDNPTQAIPAIGESFVKCAEQIAASIREQKP